MCTLSVLRQPVPPDDRDPPLWRVSFNRDERRTRPRAHPPVQHTYDGVVAVHPVDPVGGGTWIAASSTGLLFALLNGYAAADADARPRATKSRGLIIPTLLTARTTADAMARLRAIDVTEFLSFRLVMIADDDAREAINDGRTLECRDAIAAIGGAAWMRSSSSVRPEVVLPHREAAFQRDVVAPRSAAAQDAFHLMRESAQPAMGVLMEREDARTVSVTTVEAFATRMRMTYRPLDADAAETSLEIARQRR